MTVEQKNARIKSARIDIERGFAITARLSLDYGGSCQSFGGHVLLNFSKLGDAGSCDYAGEHIAKILKTVGVESWHALEGKTIRVMAEHDKVHAIGHILEDKWFWPDKDMSWKEGQQ